MPQIIAITTTIYYTDPQRAALKADIEAQLDGIDLRVLILPVGAGLQQTYAPAMPITVQAAPQPTGATISTMTVKVGSKDALDAVAALLGPGAVMLSADALAELRDAYPLIDSAIEQCGGIVSTDKAEPEPVNTPGPEYAEVQHVDDGAEVAPIRYVWLGQHECAEDQRVWAVGTDATGAWMRYAIPLDRLLPGQVEGRKVETL